MAKSKVIDVILLSVRLPDATADRTARVVLRTLKSRMFMARLRRAVEAAFGEVPILNDASVTVSR